METVCGLDIGTSGARAIAVAPNGDVVATAKRRFTHPPYSPSPGLAEQDANEWWDAGRACLSELIGRLGASAGDIAAVAVDSTSGTFVPVDWSGKPVAPALMYNDGRAAGLEPEVNRAAGGLIRRLGYTFPPAFSLVKLLWIVRERPDISLSASRFLHSADFLVGRLTGDYDCTDTSNALKSGVDLISGTWPPFIENDLGVPLSKLPRVFIPGRQVGAVSAAAALETGVPAGTPVVAGCSDGMASFLASGASSIGDWNLTIGSTIAIRGISKDLVRDSLGRFYCHRHPEGHWLPGGASNVGGEGLAKTFGESALSGLDQRCRKFLPTSLVVYPLVRTGERMPFVSSSAEGFRSGEANCEEELCAAYLEGIALTTAWSLSEASALGGDSGGNLFVSGGGARGNTLSGLLASALRRPVLKPCEPEAAMGSALLAAGWAWHGGSVSAAQRAIVRQDEIVEPVRSLVDPMQEKLERLKTECRKRGYI